MASSATRREAKPTKAHRGGAGLRPRAVGAGLPAARQPGPDLRPARDGARALDERMPARAQGAARRRAPATSSSAGT